MKDLARLVRHYILVSTTEAGSGHPTSSLSAADLMTTLYFKHLRFDGKNPKNPANDRVIFSKGHAAPLLYALCTTAGWMDEKSLMSLRKLGSPIQGHPTPVFPYAEAATGSLGQGLSVGLGMALQAKRTGLDSRTYVLMGDGEMAEGQVWEAVQVAAYYKLDNLIGIIDVNRMGQSQETMYGHDVQAYVDRVKGFDWPVLSVDGANLDEIDRAFEKAKGLTGKPVMIVAKTKKGQGISFLADKENWHGKALSKPDLEKALAELGSVDTKLRGLVAAPSSSPGLRPPSSLPATQRSLPLVEEASPAGGGGYKELSYKQGDKIATRKAYGEVLANLISSHPEIFVLDAETKNSTFAEIAAQKHPAHYAEMFIAEQNMVGVAVGLAQRGRIPFLSTFAAFLTRSFDQVRMAAVTGANIKCVGSHVGVSIGEDGPSQMGLEDIAMFRTIHGSTVLYPADAVATQALIPEMIKKKGIIYLRTSRPALPVIYPASEKFPIGGSKVLKSSAKDQVTLIAAGVTLYEALQAHDALAKEGIATRVIDLYSVKPVDEATLQKAASETKALVVIEDHWAEGGLGDAVLSALAAKPSVPVHKMAVTIMPGSGTPDELVNAAGLSAAHIVRKVKELV